MRILRYFAIGKPGFYIWYAIIIIIITANGRENQVLKKRTQRNKAYDMRFILTPIINTMIPPL